MTFKEAFEAMRHGAKVKLPSWAGYWFWCIPAQSILMHTKDGKDIDVRRTECVDYTFTNICSDEWIFADDTNCPALGGEATFSFSEAIKQLKKGRKVAREGWNGKEQYIQLATGISYKTADGETVNMMLLETWLFHLSEHREYKWDGLQVRQICLLKIGCLQSSKNDGFIPEFQVNQLGVIPFFRLLKYNCRQYYIQCLLR